MLRGKEEKQYRQYQSENFDVQYDSKVIRTWGYLALFCYHIRILNDISVSPALFVYIKDGV